MAGAECQVQQSGIATATPTRIATCRGTMLASASEIASNSATYQQTAHQPESTVCSITPAAAADCTALAIRLLIR